MQLPFHTGRQQGVERFSTAGMRCRMSAEVSKMSRKRLSTFRAAVCARAAGAKKVPASNAVNTSVQRII